MPKPLQWFSPIALIIAATTTLCLAVTLTPAASQPPSVEAEVFTRQLDFILKTNSAFLGFLGIIGALLTWFFKNNLEDAKQVAAKMVREELDAHIRDLVKTEFRYWELSAQTERVVGQTLVDYYLPNGTTEPQEYALLKHRGFRQVLFCNRLEDIRRSAGDVVILHCQNWQYRYQPALDRPEARRSRGPHSLTTRRPAGDALTPDGADCLHSRHRQIPL